MACDSRIYLYEHVNTWFVTNFIENLPSDLKIFVYQLITISNFTG